MARPLRASGHGGAARRRGLQQSRSADLNRRREEPEDNRARSPVAARFGPHRLRHRHSTSARGHKPAPPPAPCIPLGLWMRRNPAVRARRGGLGCGCSEFPFSPTTDVDIETETGHCRVGAEGAALVGEGALRRLDRLPHRVARYPETARDLRDREVLDTRRRRSRPIVSIRVILGLAALQQSDAGPTTPESGPSWTSINGVGGGLSHADVLRWTSFAAQAFKAMAGGRRLKSCGPTTLNSPLTSIVNVWEQ
jgi:hypothetical protein